MKAQELRIGNLIKHDGNIVKIDGIQPKWVWFDDMSSDVMNNIKPLPITAELLVKLDFDHVDELGMWANKNHCIKKCDGLWWIEPFCTNDSDCYIELKYIHQLQNICFALTGVETFYKP